MADLETRWSLIERAADGRSIDRAEFVRRYAPMIRAYLASRWAGTGLLDQIDDAVQECLLTFFSEDGPLQRAEPGWPGGFRAYLYGVVRNIGRTFEKRAVRKREVAAEALGGFDTLTAREEGLERILDREWARALLREAALLQDERARDRGAAARRRVELLRLRFQEDLPVREIAARWGRPADRVHREYARAREEFKESLRDVMRVHGRESRAKLDQECLRLLEHLA